MLRSIKKTLMQKSGVRRYIGPKRTLIFLLIIALVTVLWTQYRTGAINVSLIELYVDSHPMVAVVLFLLIYALSIITSLPTLPLNLAGGYFWGGILGGLLTALGVTIGGLISFLIARVVFGQPLAQRFGNDLAQKIEEEFDRNGWKFVAFARINPIIPTGPLNYLLGLTSISTKTFLLSTFIFLLPPAIGVAYIGDVMQTFSADNHAVAELVKKILITSAAITFVILIKFIAKRTKE